MSTHRTKAANCPRCGQRLSAASNAVAGNQSAPRPGDLTVCIRCESLLEFTTDLGVAELSRKALAKLPRSDRRAIEEARQVVSVGKLLSRLGVSGKVKSC